MKQLTGFGIRIGEDDQFVIRIDDNEGGSQELSASAEQVDAIIEALDDLLSEFEEEVFEVADFAPATRSEN